MISLKINKCCQSLLTAVDLNIEELLMLAVLTLYISFEATNQNHINPEHPLLQGTIAVQKKRMRWGLSTLQGSCQVFPVPLTSSPPHIYPLEDVWRITSRLSFDLCVHHNIKGRTSNMSGGFTGFTVW